jgi:peptide/nickel transport system substrate-binding protein
MLASRESIDGLTRIIAKARRRRLVLPAALACIITAGALVAAATAGADHSATSPQRTIAGNKSLTFLASADVQSLDPGRACNHFSFAVSEAVNRNVYYYKPGSLQLTPDLASRAPIVTNRGKTVTVHLRAGVRFAPPVNRAVTSADIKYGIERLFTRQVVFCAVNYYQDLVGAPSTSAHPGNYKPISGIKTPNAHTIVFHLKHRTAGNFIPALSLSGVIAVPKTYAEKYDKQNPSQYARHIVGTGPYMIQSYQPGVRIELVRNPNWRASTDFRPAKLDKITISEGNSDLSIAAQRALSGSGLACCDQSLPGPVLRLALKKPKQVLSGPAGAVQYIMLNYKIPPFNNINVRRALAATVDRQSLLLTLGGQAAAAPAPGFLPPGVPGYAPNEGSQYDFLTGHSSVAKKYMLLAKKQGLPISADGKWTGKKKFLIVGLNTDPASKAPLILQRDFQQLGFSMTARLVSSEAYYSKLCGFTQLVPAVCAWQAVFKDFPDPFTIIGAFATAALAQPLVGIAIPSKAINHAYKVAFVAQGRRQRVATWRRVNNLILRYAIAIPYAYPKNVVVESSNVRAAENPNYSANGIDFNFTDLK